MKDIEEHKNLGVGIAGNLKRKEPTETKKKPKAKKISKKKLKEGTVNKGSRTTKIEYLRHNTEMVGIINERGEYELKPTKQCGEGDVVWVMEDDGTFTETEIY